MTNKPTYFDIKLLFPVLDHKAWFEGKNYMLYWAKGTACTAINDSKQGKPTISANVRNNCMRIYKVDWAWLFGFKLALNNYNLFAQQKVFNKAAVNQLISSYGKLSRPGAKSIKFNQWLMNNLAPPIFRKQITNHQIQHLKVSPGVNDPAKFDDLIAALNNFAFYAMYKGEVFNGGEFSKLKKAPNIQLPGIPAKVTSDAVSKLMSGDYKAFIFIENVGVYMGDLYEFNGDQYLATWNIKDKKVFRSNADYLFSWQDFDDATDITVTNETYQIYRRKTGTGGDFMALTPIKLLGRKMLIPIK